MPFADFDRKLKDVGRLKQILEVLVKNELGYYVDKLKLKRFLPLSRTIESTKFIKRDTKPERLVKVFEELDGTFIKLGQLLSIRPDLVPKEYSEAFAQLQDQVLPFPYPVARAIVEKELGKKLKDLFENFEPSPIAAASIGQVHLAKLKDGKQVAIKVQRPRMGEILKTDIEIMYLFVYLMDKYHHPDVIDPKEIVEEFEDYTSKEINYLNEAKNIEAFHRNFDGDDSTKIPAVYWDHTTEKVLTIEYIKGKKLSTLLKSKKLFNRKLIAKNIVESILKQVFEHGVFHADPHPGNIIVLPNYKIAWLDFGIVGYFSEEMREKVTDLFISIVRKDIVSLAQNLLDLGVVDKEVDIEIFKADIQKTIGKFYGAGLKDINLGEMFQEILNLSKKHSIKLPRDLILLGKTVVTTEGVAAELDQNFNLITIATPFVEKLIKRKTSPKYIFSKVAKSAKEFKSFITDMPKQTNELLSRIKKTEKIAEQIDTDIRGLGSEIDKSSNRIALGLLITAFLISSALIMNVEQPKFVGIPVFSLAGFMIAFFLFFVLTVSIRREKI